MAMLRLILSNRWFALIWVALIALSAQRFAGKDGQGIKAVEQATAKLEARQKSFQAQAEADQDLRRYADEEPDQPALGEGYDPTPKEVLPDQR